MDYNAPDKITGSTFTASEHNALKQAVNSKVDKTSISQVIDANSTIDTIPTSKAVYDFHNNNSQSGGGSGSGPAANITQQDIDNWNNPLSSPIAQNQTTTLPSGLSWKIAVKDANNNNAFTQSLSSAGYQVVSNLPSNFTFNSDPSIKADNLYFKPLANDNILQARIDKIANNYYRLAAVFTQDTLIDGFTLEAGELQEFYISKPSAVLIDQSANVMVTPVNNANSNFPNSFFCTTRIDENNDVILKVINLGATAVTTSNILFRLTIIAN